MKRIGKLALTVALFGSGIWIGSTMVTKADSVSSQPGTIDDPLVTKGYVDSQISSLVETQIEEYLEKNGGTSSATSSSLEVITLSPGDTLYADEGTELILRVGKAYAVSNDANGIPDVTEGTNLEAGAEIPRDHLLLFPREGRGIRADETENNSVIVMAVGSYMHLDADGNMVE